MACLDRETAMSYLRGDLEPEEAERWSAHLAICESCRRRLREVSELVDDVRQELMLADVSAGQDWRGLERLIRNETAGQTSSRPFAWIRSRTFAAVAASLVVAAIVFWTRGDSASAAEILNRATLAEQTLQGQPDQVIHRVLTIEERRGPTRALTSRQRVEHWRKSGSARSARRAFDEAGRLVGAEWIDPTGTRTVRGTDAGVTQATQGPAAPELLASGRAWQVDLSATVFATLLPTPDAARVTESASAVSIRYEPKAAGEIASALLVLSPGDLHAIEQTIRIGQGQDQREYRFAEDRVAVVAADSVPAAIFEPDVPAPAESRPTSRSVAAPRAMSLERLLGLEVEALRLLDTAGALLGEQVAVSRTGNRVRVHAMVDSDERKQQLVQVMAPLAVERGVDIDIQTFAAVARREADDTSAVRFSQVEITAGDIPVAQQLRRHFAGADDPVSPDTEDQVRRFAAAAVEHSQSIVQHAWAMKRLHSRYSPEEIAALPPQTRATWQRLIAEHALEIVKRGSALVTLLQPVFLVDQLGSVAELAAGRDPSDDATRTLEQILDLSHSLDQAIRAAFSASTVPASADTFVATSQFFDRLNELVGLARRVDFGK